MPESGRKQGRSPDVPAGASWEHFPHVADVGVRGFGPDLAGAFEQAAVAMTAVVTDPGEIELAESVEVNCNAPNLELLLVDWLNAIVFEMATRKMLFGDFRVRIDGHSLAGTALGERIDVERHQPATEVKGATLSELEVARSSDGSWRAQCIVDV